MYVVYWLGVAQAGPMLSVFAESHVDVGITMHILSISSLSEVQMVHTCALRYALLSTTSKTVVLRPRRRPAAGRAATPAARFVTRDLKPPSSRGDSGPHLPHASHAPGRPRVGSPRLGFSASTCTFYIHIYFSILYKCLSVSCVPSAGKPSRGRGRVTLGGARTPAGVGVGRLGGAGARQGPGHHSGLPPPPHTD